MYCQVTATSIFQIPKAKMWIIILQMFLQLMNHTGGKEVSKCKIFVLLDKKLGPSYIFQDIDRISPRAVFFYTILRDGMYDNIVFQTNLYAQQKGKSFKPITKSELRIFMGINFLMGIKKSPSYRDYWSANVSLRCDFIANAMGRTRFEWILPHLHLNDNMSEVPRDDPRFDKLHKVRPLLGCLNSQFQSCYNPSEIQTIDGSMIKFNTMPRGESDWRMDPSSISVTKRTDTKSVMFIANMHNPLEMSTVSRRKKDGTIIDVTAPIIVNF